MKAFLFSKKTSRFLNLGFMVLAIVAAATAVFNLCRYWNSVAIAMQLWLVFCVALFLSLTVEYFLKHRGKNIGTLHTTANCLGALFFVLIKWFVL